MVWSETDGMVVLQHAAVKRRSLARWAVPSVAAAEPHAREIAIWANSPG